MNRIIVSGNLGQDVDILQSSNGNMVGKFSLAVKRRFAKEGDVDTDWFNAVCFGKTCEFASKYLRKGSKVLIEGELQNNNYEKDGVKHYSNQIIVKNVEFAESKKSGESKKEEEVPTNSDGFFDIPDGIEEELPFM